MDDYYLLLFYNIYQLCFSKYNYFYVIWLALSSTISNGTPTFYLDSLITNEVFTLATFSAEVNSSVRNVWKVLRSGATHLRIKSTSPFSCISCRTRANNQHFSMSIISHSISFFCWPTAYNPGCKIVKGDCYIFLWIIFNYYFNT